MANTTKIECPICKLKDQQVLATGDYGRRRKVECKRCGVYPITGTAEAIAARRKLGVKLSAWTRDRNELGIDIPEITSETINNFESNLPEYTVSEKQIILLRHLGRKSEYPGKNVQLFPHLDYPLAWAAGEDELVYLLESLSARNLITKTSFGGEEKKELPRSFIVTPEGWSFLDEKAKPSAFSDQAFVAMSFSTSLKPLWQNAIIPAIAKAGYRPYRVDLEPHIDKIDAKIVSEINNSRFLVADVTEQRPGVYFEAGYAIGKGIPVIWSVKKVDLENVHFDTRQYNHIVWENEYDMEQQLYFVIAAVIGKKKS